MKVLRIVFVVFMLCAAAAVALLGYLFKVRPGLDQYQAHIHRTAPAEPGQLTATWFGVTALLLSDGTSAIMVDPFFTRPGGWAEIMRNRPIEPNEPLIKEWLKKAGVERLDAVIVSHSHYDHAMDAGVVARLTGAALVGSESTANIGRGSGLDESQILVANPGVPILYGNYTFTLFESRHAGATGGRPKGNIKEPLVAPAHYYDYRQGGTFSILIEHEQGKVLHHGSAGWLPGMLERQQADVVFLGIAARPKLNEYLRAVVDRVGATRVVPMHWDDFTRPLDQPLVPLPFGADLDGFFREAALRPDLKVQTLEVGAAVVLFPREE
jgi:L-ascorbate metabolism protein UlaG (beta-lactamase superfamily)